jgi:hypothetical protein
VLRDVSSACSSAAQNTYPSHRSMYDGMQEVFEESLRGDCCADIHDCSRKNGADCGGDICGRSGYEGEYLQTHRNTNTTATMARRLLLGSAS